MAQREEMLTTTQDDDTSATALAKRTDSHKHDVTLKSSDFWKSLKDDSSINGPKWPSDPALLMSTTLSYHDVEMACSTSASISSSRVSRLDKSMEWVVASRVIPCASAVSSILSLVWFSPSCDRATKRARMRDTSTCLQKAQAVAEPRPLEAPVTSSIKDDIVWRSWST